MSDTKQILEARAAELLKAGGTKLTSLENELLTLNAGSHTPLKDNEAKLIAWKVWNRDQEEKKRSATDQEAEQFRVYSLSDAFEEDPEQQHWLIEGILQKDAAAITSGKPHARKSLSWLACAIEAVTKGTCWGQHKVHAVRSVLFLEAEDSKNLLKKRIRGLAKGQAIDHKNLSGDGFFWMRTGRFDLVKRKGQLLDVLDRIKPNLLILSTLQAFVAGRDLNEQKEMSDVMDVIADIVSRYCSVVLITHSPQAKNSKRAIGTITQEANFATILYFEKKAADHGVAVTKVKLDTKDGESREFALRLGVRVLGKNGSGQDETEVRTVEVMPASKAELVRKALADDPDAPAAVIAQQVGCNPSYVYQIIEAMEKESGAESSPDSSTGDPILAGAGKGKTVERHKKRGHR
jgi:AAA domain